MKKRHFERPGYVTLIGVLILAGALAELLLLVVETRAGKDFIPDLLMTGDNLAAVVWSLAGGNFMFRSPDAMSWAYFVVSLICGVFMLRGANWSRILFYTGYLGLCVWSYVSWMTGYPLTIPYVVVRAVILGVFCVALSMEGANRFFTGRDALFKGKRRRGDVEPSKTEAGWFDY